MNFYVDTSELDALVVDFNAAAAQAPKEAAKIVRKATEDTAKQARRRAPVDTGALRSSIQTRFSGGGLNGRVEVGVHYAGFVEYGTSRMRPQPYMRPAIQSVEPDFIKAMEEITEGLI